MDILVNENTNINFITFRKMSFIFNALNHGWTIKKRGEKFVFFKKHEGEKEIFLDDYIKRFITENINIDSDKIST
tara:strand:+ start:276 stop:500 length:225 start_codon:yes stop_codon:yes gene_type:complete